MYNKNYYFQKPFLRISISYIAIFLLLFIVGCSEEKTVKSTTYSEGQMVRVSECGGFQTGKARNDSLACIEFEYDGNGVLTLHHTNAVFNCCPDSLWAEFDIENGQINIIEKEFLISGGCRCVCSYDIDYQISGLNPGAYSINIIERYGYFFEDYEPLEFNVNLFSDTSGIYCVPRPEVMTGSL